MSRHPGRLGVGSVLSGFLFPTFWAPGRVVCLPRACSMPSGPALEVQPWLVAGCVETRPLPHSRGEGSGPWMWPGDRGRCPVLSDLRGSATLQVRSPRPRGLGLTQGCAGGGLGPGPGLPDCRLCPGSLDTSRTRCRTAGGWYHPSDASFSSGAEGKCASQLGLLQQTWQMFILSALEAGSQRPWCLRGWFP